jgi:hypothetical protein
MHASRHVVGVLNRVLYLAKLRAAALRRYEHGGTTGRMRASVVARDVARDVDVTDSPVFRADLTVALRSAGWRSVKNAQVRLWEGVRRK